MSIDEALIVVLELAKQNCLTEEQVSDEPALIEEASKQLEAINMVEDLIVNEFGDES